MVHFIKSSGLPQAAENLLDKDQYQQECPSPVALQGYTLSTRQWAFLLILSLYFAP